MNENLKLYKLAAENRQYIRTFYIAHPDGRIIPFDTYNIFYRHQKTSGQLLIFLPAAIILLILRKWEIAVGLFLADITLFFLGYLVCIV